MTATADAVEAYIAALPDRVRELFLAVRAAARSAAPDAEERISYGMPALFQGGVLAYYGAFKRHVGLYPPPATEALRVESASYAGPKGNLKFRVGEPAPELLVSEIVRERLRQNQCKATGRNPKKSPP